MKDLATQVDPTMVLHHPNLATILDQTDQSMAIHNQIILVDPTMDHPTPLITTVQEFSLHMTNNNIKAKGKSKSNTMRMATLCLQVKEVLVLWHWAPWEDLRPIK